MALTTQDIAKIGKLVSTLFETQFTDRVREIVKEEVGFLPTKDEFYTKMDEVMGELQAIRDEHTAIGFRVSEHSDQIAALERIHPSGKHTP